MNKTQILNTLRSEFQYVRDPKGWDVWKVGRTKGDCEDFSLTLAWRLAGENRLVLFWHLLTFKTVIWHVKASHNGEGHAALWHRGMGWADNIFPTWANKTRHSKRFPFLLPQVAVKLALGLFFR